MKVVEMFALKEGLEEIVDFDLNFAQAHKVLKTLDLVLKEYSLVEKMRLKVYEKYGEKDGERIMIKPENTKIAQEELDKLLFLDIDFNLEPFLNEEGFGDIKIKTRTLSKLRPILKD